MTRTSAGGGGIQKGRREVHLLYSKDNAGKKRFKTVLLGVGEKREGGGGQRGGVNTEKKVQRVTRKRQNRQWAGKKGTGSQVKAMGTQSKAGRRPAEAKNKETKNQRVTRDLGGEE